MSTTRISPVEKSGYLTKQGGTVKNWRKRWIVLKNSSLQYFKSKDDPNPVDTIPLSNDCSCALASYHEAKKKHCLKIVTPKRIWLFAGESDEEIVAWLDALLLSGIPESHEEDDVISAIMDATHNLQAVATAVFQYSQAGALEMFRDTCRAATQRVDAFTSSLQVIAKYNPSIKYSPTPNYNDFQKEILSAASSIRDTFLALVTIATDARDSPHDAELRRKLKDASSAIKDKIIGFKDTIQDDTKGLRPQLRCILYGKDKMFTSPTAHPPVPTLPTNIIGMPARSSSPGPLTSSPSTSAFLTGSPAAYGNPPSPQVTRSPRPASLTLSGKDPLSLAYRLSSTPPTDKVEKQSLYNSLLKSSVSMFENQASTPPTLSSSPALPPPNPALRMHARSMSFNGLFTNSLGSTPTTIPQSILDEQKTQFDDVISMSKDLAQIMKSIRPDESGVTILPKSGHVTATMLVKAARDYANLNQDPVVRQEILAAAGRVFFATNQLYSSVSTDEEYSTDDLLRALSQSVLALVKIVLHHHNTSNPPASPTSPTSPVSLPSSPVSSPIGSPALSSHPLAPPSSSHHALANSGELPPSLLRSSSNGRLEVPSKKVVAPSRYGSGNLNGRVQINEATNDAPPTLITSTEGDVNIWEEVPIEGTNVVFIDDEGLSADGERPIRAGTLNQIMKRLTNENKPELRFVKAFIITHPSFTTPEVFLNKLIQRYQVPVSVIEEGTQQNGDWRQQKLLPIQLRIYNVLKLWLENRFHDFDEALLSKLKVFMEEYMRRDGHAKLADQLSSIINRKTANEPKKALSFPTSTTLTKEAFWKKYPGEYFLNLDEEEVAKQLTLMEFSTYKSIEPLELLNQAWNKASLRKRAPNVMRMIQRFNATSFWVAKVILNEEKLRTRVKVMTKVIRLAQALYKENNLNSLLAIVAGLNNSAVHRLSFTREELSTKDSESLAKFGSLLSTDMGYKNYRNRIHTINPPLIPYLGIYLTDLTFIEDGNPDFIDGHLINFKKREMIFNVISEIQQYQQEPYRYEPIDQLIEYVAEIPLIEDTRAMDNVLYDLSLLREPRNSQKSDIV